MATKAETRDSGKDAATGADAAEIARMKDVLARQRAAFTDELPVPMKARKDRLDRLIALLVDHGEDLCKAMSEDFGHRSREQSMMTDIVGTINAAKHARKHCEKWAKPDKRKVQFPLNLLGAKARVEYQPLGVVGVIAPWNFPVQLCLTPAAAALAAGNRVMIKNSEYTEATSELLKRLGPDYFAEEEVAFFTGGPDAGQAFSSLAFDHLIFTGATGIGRHVMRAAAENLTPVTLELGGKSPTIVGRSADMGRVGERVGMGKMMNAGQICLAPDYMLVPEECEAEVIDSLKEAVSSMYPTLLDNDDYTAVLNARHHQRLTGYVEDAREKGAEVIVVNPANEDFASANVQKMPLHILRGVNEDMTVMQEEIFGPVLPVMTYRDVDEAISYVNAHDRPLGLYYFGGDGAEEQRVLDRTVSGGVTVNDVIFHCAMEDLPFGGVGPSGMGAYHGRDGFRTFSHAKAVYEQPKINVAKLAGFMPPYGGGTEKAIARDLKK